MATQKELNNAKEKFEKDKNCLEFNKDNEDIYKNIFKIGLAGLVYLGVRNIMGPEINFTNEPITTPLQFFDTIGMALSYMGGLIGGLSYGLTHLDKRSSEKNLKNSKSELEKLSEDYKFSRGHI